MKEIEVWEVKEEDDGGWPRHLCYASNERTARAIGARPENFIPRGKGEPPTPMVSKTVIRVFDTPDEYEEYRLTEVQRLALGKLTPEERKALGF